MADAGFIAHLSELFSPHAHFEARRMFGGWGLYLDGLMCGLVADGQLHLKVDAETQAAFEAAGSAPFVYTGQARPITLSYWTAPDDALESAEAMRPWALRALAAAQRAAARRRVARPRRSTRRGR